MNSRVEEYMKDEITGFGLHHFPLEKIEIIYYYKRW